MWVGARKLNGCGDFRSRVRTGRRLCFTLLFVTFSIFVSVAATPSYAEFSCKDFAFDNIPESTTIDSHTFSQTSSVLKTTLLWERNLQDSRLCILGRIWEENIFDKSYSRNRRLLESNYYFDIEIAGIHTYGPHKNCLFRFPPLEAIDYRQLIRILKKAVEWGQIARSEGANIEKEILHLDESQSILRQDFSYWRTDKDRIIFPYLGEAERQTYRSYFTSGESGEIWALRLEFLSSVYYFRRLPFGNCVPTENELRSILKYNNDTTSIGGYIVLVATEIERFLEELENKQNTVYARMADAISEISDRRKKQRDLLEKFE